MKRIAFGLVLAAVPFLLTPSASVQGAGDKVHKLVIQVSDNDPVRINLALNNASNATAALGLDNVLIEIVAYGPGLDLFLKDSKYAPRLQSLFAGGNVKYGVCHMTMKARHLTEADLIQADYAQKSIVPSGAVRIMELEEQGYSYIRP